MVVMGSIGPHVNKFEQISSDNHHMSLGGVGVSRGGGTPYHVTYPIMHVISSIPRDQT